MKKDSVIRIKNLVLLFLSVICPVVCRLTGQQLPSVQSELESESPYIRNMESFLYDNRVMLPFFIVFLSISLTSFMLGSVIFHRFDRNRATSRMSVLLGLFYLTNSAYFITYPHTVYASPLYREITGYIAGALVMMIPHLFANFADKVYQKKTISVMEWMLTVPSVCFFCVGMLPVPQAFFDIVVIVEIILYLALFIFCVAVHIRNISAKIDGRRVILLILCWIQMPLLIASAVLFLLKDMNGFFLCYGFMLVIMAYLSVSELLNHAARQYVKSFDAENFRKMAYIDGLCNISNRNAFLLEQEETFNCDSLVYVVFDVNNLKKINDRFGHAAGDEIIKKAAEIISRSFESVGKSFRIGGDEFAVIGQYKTEEQVEKAISDMENKIIRYNKNAEAKLDLAYGYAMRDNTGISTYELFNKADKAMYRCKRRGKGIFLQT